MPNKQNIIWLQQLNVGITDQKLRIAKMNHQNCMVYWRDERTDTNPRIQDPGRQAQT